MRNHGERSSPKLSFAQSAYLDQLPDHVCASFQDTLWKHALRFTPLNRIVFLQKIIDKFPPEKGKKTMTGKTINGATRGIGDPVPRSISRSTIPQRYKFGHHSPPFPLRGLPAGHNRIASYSLITLEEN